MAIGAGAAAEARRGGAGGDEDARRACGRGVDRLVGNPVGERGDAWGYHFDVQTRFFFYPRTSPNSIATSFVLQTLIEGSNRLGRRDWDEAIRAGAEFLLDTMLVDTPGRVFFRYVPRDDQLIHNASVLVCAALARAAAHLEEPGWVEPARRALPATLAAQRPDGSWPYAEAGGDWVDNFHTGYVLEALVSCVDLHPDVGRQLDAGVDFWDRELFLPDGKPKFLPDRPLPFDAQCYAQAIETWLALADRQPQALDRARRGARRLVEDMLAPSGHVYFQRRRLVTSRVPFVRWSTAPAFSALARLRLAEASAERASLEPGGVRSASGSI
jgi:hypothetical protein